MRHDHDLLFGRDAEVDLDEGLARNIEWERNHRP
jgi:hypothetical protein